MYMGVPIKGKRYMFGDNESVITSSTIPDSILQKRHLALAYHRVREAIASKDLAFYHMDGKRNPADILSKHWGYQQIWQILQPILFWQGDTAKLIPASGDTLQGNGECQVETGLSLQPHDSSPDESSHGGKHDLISGWSSHVIQFISSC